MVNKLLQLVDEWRQF